MLLVFLLTAFFILSLFPLLAHWGGRPRLKRASADLGAVATRLVRGAFSISAAAGLLIVMVQMISLLSRNIFAVNFIWIQESALYLFGAMFLLSSGAILLADDHVRVDVLYSRWSGRRRRLVDLLGIYVFVIPVCGLIIYASWPYVAQSWATLERSSEPTGIHLVYLLKSMIPAFGVLVGLGAIARAEGLLSGTIELAPSEGGSHAG